MISLLSYFMGTISCYTLHALLNSYYIYNLSLKYLTIAKLVR